MVAHDPAVDARGLADSLAYSTLKHLGAGQFYLMAAKDNDGAGLESRRKNAQKLIRAGALVTPGTDSYWAAARELTRTPKFEEQDHGIGTIMAIEGLVELGMTPSQAIVAGTRNGATASRRLADFGTIEPGKIADLVLLSADPLADIKNIRKVDMVFKDGRAVDRARLPETRVLSVVPPASKAGTGSPRERYW